MKPESGEAFEMVTDWLVNAEAPVPVPVPGATTGLAEEEAVPDMFVPRLAPGL